MGRYYRHLPDKNSPEQYWGTLRKFQKFYYAGATKQSIMQPITDHEVEILGYIQKGYNNRQIAEAVKQSDRTGKNQLNLIFAKLNAKNRNHAVALAIEKGLISLGKLD